MNSHRIRHILYRFNDIGNIVKAKDLVKNNERRLVFTRLV